MVNGDERCESLSGVGCGVHSMDCECETNGTTVCIQSYTYDWIPRLFSRNSMIRTYDSDGWNTCVAENPSQQQKYFVLC